ncbi:flagellar hook-length control protein FliK [Peribacillus psychrosaccharolyticus]|uniref:flagellar hook-length control protein FliK n=1 Tax=Peribacillus psychrosaccharolyticus TaxID=1407 RepID=UPI003D2B0BCC
MNTGGILLIPASGAGGVTSQASGITIESAPNMTMFGSVFTGALKSDEQPIVIEEPVSEQQVLINSLISFLNIDTLTEVEEISAQQIVSTDPLELGTDELIQAMVKDLPSLINLIAGLVEEGALQEIELDVEECLVTPEQVLTINLLDLYTLIKEIDETDVEEWKESKAAGMAEAVKLAKIQLLDADTQVMKPQDLPLTKELKQLLENISAKLDKLSGTNIEVKKSNSTIIEKNSRISLDALRSTFTRIVGDEGNSSEKSKPVTMKANESSQGTLPFQMSKLEQYMLTTEKNGQPIDQEQFIKQFEKIMNKASFTGTNGMQKLLIKLNPEHLGALRIEIIQKDTGLTARIMATTSKGKEMLETQLQALKQSFAAQGIQVDKIDITQTTSFQERFTPRDTESQQQRQQSKEQPKEDSEETQNEFTHRFAEALVNYEI